MYRNGRTRFVFSPTPRPPRGSYYIALFFDPRRPALSEWQRAYFAFCQQWRCNRRNRRRISRLLAREAPAGRKKCTFERPEITIFLRFETAQNHAQNHRSPQTSDHRGADASRGSTGPRRRAACVASAESGAALLRRYGPKRPWAEGSDGLWGR